ncbi:MAG: hypothetical protein ACYDHO_02520 [Gaiellaceae bacterium]
MPPLISESGIGQTTLTRGAYGLRLAGLGGSTLVSPVPESWPQVRVERRAGDDRAPARPSARANIVEFDFPNGSSVWADRRRSTITFLMPPEVEDDELVHPYLSPAAVQFAGWLGHTVFHSGAFVHDGGAWALLGVRSAGKSTTLARLAQLGTPVLSDDILVFDEASALAGPRCIDLRPDAAKRLEEGSNIVRGGDRCRLTLPAIEPALPLRGFFFLEWGDELAAHALRPAERLDLMNRSCRPETARPVALLELAQLPAWRLARPRGFEALDEVCGKLLDTAQG